MNTQIIDLQERNLDILYSLGFQCDFSEYLDYDFEEKVYYLAKKDGTGKIFAEVYPDGSVNHMSIEAYLKLI